MKNNWLKSIAGIITNNFGLKLLALIVSCGLWFVVDNITDPVAKKTFYTIPVDIINDDMITNEGKVYEVLDGTNYVNVTVMGKTSVLDNVTKDDIKAVADMAELTFMNTVGIQISSTRSNSELEFIKNIDNMKLSIEDMERIQLRIKASITGEPAKGYVVGGVSTSQNVVRLTGPESLIKQISYVEATANIEGYSSDINTSAELKFYDADGREIKGNSITTNISAVNVAVTILDTKAVPLNFVVGEPAEGYVADSNTISVPKTILLAGKKSVLDGVSKINVEDASLSLEDRTESLTAVVNVQKFLPSGTQFADSSFDGNVSVTIPIEPVVTKDLHIPARNFAVGNKPEGFKVTLSDLEDADEYTIRISGTQAAVDAVSEEGVIGSVDMDALLEKLGLAEWASGSYSGNITFNLPDNVRLEAEYAMALAVEELAQEEAGE